VGCVGLGCTAYHTAKCTNESQAVMSCSSVLSPDADDALPRQETQLASTSEAKQKQKQKSMWRGPDNVTWDPNPSAVRSLPPSHYKLLPIAFQDQLTDTSHRNHATWASTPSGPILITVVVPR
jgi:hypothetical protein